MPGSGERPAHPGGVPRVVGPQLGSGSEAVRTGADRAAGPGDAEQGGRLAAGWGGYDLAITSYDLLKRDIPLLRGKNIPLSYPGRGPIYQKTITLRTPAPPRRWTAGSGSPHRHPPIENRLSELWSIFDFLMPGFLYGYGRFKGPVSRPRSSKAVTGKVDRLSRMTSPLSAAAEAGRAAELPEKTEKRAATLEGDSGGCMRPMLPRRGCVKRTKTISAQEAGGALHPHPAAGSCAATPRSVMKTTAGAAQNCRDGTAEGSGGGRPQGTAVFPVHLHAGDSRKRLAAEGVTYYRCRDPRPKNGPPWWTALTWTVPMCFSFR